MSARPRHRSAIISAAARLFRRHGFAATGLAQIVEASGAPKGSLYHYFPAGKSEIGAAAVAAAGVTVTATLAALPDGQGPGDFLRDYARRLAGWMRASGFSDGCPIATTVLEEAARDEAIAAVGLAAFNDWRGVIADRLALAGLNDGNSRQLALLAVSALEGALILARAERSDRPILAVGDTLGQIADSRSGPDSPAL